MAIQTINPGPGFGANIGEALGTGIQNLANMQLNDVLKQKQEKQLQHSLRSILPGLEKQQYEALSQTPMELLQPYVKQELKRTQEEAYAEAILGDNKNQPTGINKPRLTGEQALKVSEHQFKKQKHEEAQKTKRIEAIEKANKPYLDRFSKAVELAQQKKDISEEMKRLYETGKVANSYWGYIPKVGQNPETQRFIELGQDLASILATEGTGVATNFKIKLATERKANVTQDPEAQLENINFMIKQADKMLSIDEIKNKIIEENNGEQPANIQTQIMKRYNEQKGVGSIIEKLNQLVAAGKYKVGDEIKHKSSGNTFVVTPEGVKPKE